MTIETLYLDINSGAIDLDDIISLEVTEGYKQATARFNFETYSLGGLDLNDDITIDIGYSGDHGQVFEGSVDTITTTRRPGVYEVTGRDILKRAIEHMLVTTDLDNPFSRRNISAENLVRDLLAEAGLTNYVGQASSFTYGVSGPAEFNLISSWDAIERISMIIAWKCYAIGDTVYFDDTQPVPEGSAVNTFSVGDSGNITGVSYDYSTDNLRNKVVAFGKDGIYAEASRATSYDPRTGTFRQVLPADFYKTAIVSSPLIDSQTMADQSVQYNLELYNRITESVRLDVLGDHSLRARQTVTASENFTSVTGDWFIYSISHRVDNNGYTCTLHLTR